MWGQVDGLHQAHETQRMYYAEMRITMFVQCIATQILIVDFATQHNIVTSSECSHKFPFNVESMVLKQCNATSSAFSLFS